MGGWKDVKSTILREESDRPVAVKIAEYGDVMYLDIRRMYRKPDHSLGYTKRGVHLELEGGMAEEVMLAAQALLEEYMIW